jgi:metallo-beta-lactamase class B
MRVAERGTVREAVIVGSPNVNPGYRLVRNSKYPTITEDLERTFRVLRALPTDYFLGAHGSYFDLEAKYARLQKGDSAAFIDPEGYRNYVANREQAFRVELARQQRDSTR